MLPHPVPRPGLDRQTIFDTTSELAKVILRCIMVSTWVLVVPYQIWLFWPHNASSDASLAEAKSGIETQDESGTASS
jgi:hypothetical protein